MQAPGERRRHQHIGREAVDVIVDDLAREQDDTHELGRKTHRRLGRVRIGSSCDLGSAHCPEFDCFADVPTGDLGRLGRRDHLVGAARIGHVTLRHGHAVLGEVLTANAPDGGHVVVESARSENPPVSPKRDDEEVRGTRHGRDLGKALEALGQVGSAEAVFVRDVIGLQAQIRGVGGSKIGREGGLRSPGACYGCHGKAADEPEEDDDGDIAGPPAGQTGTKAVPGDAKGWSQRADPPFPPGIAHLLTCVRGYLIRLWVSTEQEPSRSARERALVLALRPGPR